MSDSKATLCMHALVLLVWCHLGNALVRHDVRFLGKNRDVKYEIDAMDSVEEVLLPRYAECWSAGPDMDSRDAACEIGLKCARYGYDGRTYGDCDMHCCSKEAHLPQYTECWDAGSDLASRDAACAGNLKCARRGYDGRDYGDCDVFHCCSQEDTSSVVDYFEDVGAGCCSGPRDEGNGKLWTGETATLEDCKAKCLAFENCEVFEFGWTTNSQWCFLWNEQQGCKSLDAQEYSCGAGGGNNGVHAYKRVRQELTPQMTHHSPRVLNMLPTNFEDELSLSNQHDKFATRKVAFEKVGKGCCSGPRNQKHGKLWAGQAPTLEICQAKCSEYENCGAVEYGWSTNAEWCFIWNIEQSCLSLEWGETSCGDGGGDNGVHAYRVKTPEAQRPRKSVLPLTLLPPKLQDSDVPSSTSHRNVDLVLVGAGCCGGIRDAVHGKLWAGQLPTLGDCKAKCRDLVNCGAMEYGWGTNEQWCFIWSDQQACLSLEWGSEDCGDGGGNNGVHAYRVKVLEESKPKESPLMLPAQPAKFQEQSQAALPATLDFEDLGVGCCSGARNEENGKLWAGEVPTVADCQSQCKALGDCSFIEYGWNANKRWCFIWNKQQACRTLESGAKSCGMGGGSNGVRTYRVKASVESKEVQDKSKPLLLPAAAHEARRAPNWVEEQEQDAENEIIDFLDIGAGCCLGERDERNGKLWAGETPTLVDCKAMCRSFDNCGAIEYGWKKGNAWWCFIWSEQQSCAILDWRAEACGQGGGDNGVHSYKISRTRKVALDVTPLLPSSSAGLQEAPTQKAEKPRLRDHLLDRFIVVPEHKLLFCYMENVDAFSFNDLFARLRMRYNSTIYPMNGSTGWFQNAPKNHGLDLKGLENILADGDWHKAVFYSDPLERFVTGYKEKCEQKDEDGALVCSRAFGEEDTPFDAAVERMSELDERAGFDPDMKVNEHFQRQLAYCGGLADNLKYYTTVEPLQKDTVRSKVINLLSSVYAEHEWIDNFDALFPEQGKAGDLSQNERNTKLLQQVRTYLPPEKPYLIEKLFKHYEGDYRLFNMSLPRWEEVQAPVLKNHLLDRFFIVPEHKLLFCYMEKNACTSFNKLFTGLRKKYNDSFIVTHGNTGWFQSVPYDQGYDLNDLEHILADDTWHKALFYRDPVERFVSAYRSKCEHADDDGEEMCYRAFGDQSASFTTAVDHMSRLDARADFDPDNTMNVHWQRQLSFCGGIEHNLKYYNTVESLVKETANTKVANLLEKVGAKTEWMPNFNELFPLETEDKDDNFLEKKHNTGTGDHIVDYFPRDRPEMLEKLIKHYEGDYKLFGIQPPSWEADRLVELAASNSSSLTARRVRSMDWLNGIK